MQTRPNFTSFGVDNPPGAGASGLRVALDLLQSKHIKSGTLQGAANNTLYIPIPGQVDASNFATEYDQVKNLPPAYALDGIITQQQADSFFS